MGLITNIIIMIDKLEAVENSLKLWRAIILLLSIIMLIVSFIGDDEMAIIVLIICLFALILFQLKNLPSTSYQLFILLQLAYFIFLAGKLLETLYYRPQTHFSYVVKNTFYLLTLCLFIIILWRHYQKDQLLVQMNVEEEGVNG